MNRYIYRLAGTVTFPEGIMPGEGGKSNNFTVAKNGKNQPVLRGSSLAGALRASFTKRDADFWFGRPLDTADTVSDDSRVSVADMVLNSGKSAVTTRTHNLINRHTGAVVDGGLYSLESLPPDTTGTLLLYINSRGQETNESDFMEKIGQVLGSGMTLGGNRNRGIGRLQCAETLHLHRFDVSTIEGYAAWMNARYADRKGSPVGGGEKLALKSEADQFVLDVTLGIPRGEDFVIGSGKTMDHQAEPQKIAKADGKEYWRIPGSTIRGVFRAWMTRLAVCDGKNVRDDADAFFQGRQITGDDIGWGFIPKTERSGYQQNPEALNDPILDLFGSLYKRGRIHFADAFSSKSVEAKDTQLRTHVAIDRFSGGANEGMLFDNTVLIGDMRFTLRIAIDAPKPEEITWLEKSLKALHLGVLSIGSSKGSGRLEVKECKGAGKSVETAKTINEFAEGIQ